MQFVEDLDSSYYEVNYGAIHQRFKFQTFVGDIKCSTIWLFSTMTCQILPESRRLMTPALVFTMAVSRWFFILMCVCMWPNDITQASFTNARSCVAAIIINEQHLVPPIIS